MEKANQREITTGLVSGLDHSMIPRGSWISSLGVVISGDEDTEPFISRENGTNLCLTLPLGWRLRGHVYSNNNTILAIWSNNESFQIAKITQDCKIEILLKDSCIKITNFVDMTYRVRNGCEDVIYFTDCDNPVMSINLSNLECYKVNGVYDCSLMELFRPYTIPCLETATVVSIGGSVRYGSYSVGIQYLDSDLNPTATTYMSSYVTVSDSDYGIFNFDINNLIGKKLSNKSIKYIFSNLDIRFESYRLIIVEHSSGNGIPTKYYATNKISIHSNEYIFTGNIDDLVEVDKNEIYDKNTYYRAKYIDQTEDRLILGYLKGAPYKFCDWQKFASKIKVSWIVEEIDADKYIEKGMETGVWDNTFMADEVHAASIVYVDRRGNHYYGFHIPGPALNKDIDCKDLPKKLPTCLDRDIYVTINVFVLDADGFRVNERIEVVYFVNNIRKVKIINFDEFHLPSDGDYKYLIDSICDTDSIRLGTITYNSKTDNYNLKITSSVETSIYFDPIVPPLSGWDDTVYPEWNSDMEHIITEDRYKELINIFNAKSPGKITYGSYSESNLNLLKKVEGLPKRYEIYNTAGRNGRLAYHQCKSAVYENPTKGFCADYYGVDYCGNSLEGTPIRHIKLPDRSMVALYSNGKLRRLGLKFENIEYPHEDIVGHYICFSKKTVENRTVIDKGIATPAAIGGRNGTYNVLGFSYWTRYQVPDLMTYVSPAMLLGDESLSGSHIKTENLYTYWPFRLDCIVLDGDGISFIDKDIILETRQIDQKGAIAPNQTNYKIKSQYVLNENTRYPVSDILLTNMSLLSKIGFIFLDEPFKVDIPSSDVHHADILEVASNDGGDNRGSAFQVPSYLYYISIKSSIDVHCVLDNIVYERAHNCMHTGKQSVVWGNTYMTRMDFTSLLVREVYDLGIGFLQLIGFGPQFEAIVEDRALDRMSRITNFVAFACELMSSWVESDYNWQLRSNGYNEDTLIYKHFFTGGRTNDILLSYMRSKLLESEKKLFGTVFIPKNAVVPDFYLYNKDYKSLKGISSYYPIPSTYNFSSECVEVFSRRVAYSEKSFGNENTDNYRVFKPNNFRDIPSDNNEITDIFIDNNDLYVHTTDALWKFIYGRQEVVRNGLVTFIGDGSYFPIPPVKIINSDTGYAGSLHRHSTVKTPGGVIFVDELSHNVFIINSGINSLIDSHSEFFTKYLKSHLRSVIPNHRYDDAYNLGTYDEINKRYILTKRDKIPLLDGIYSFKNGNYHYEDKLIDINDPVYFKDFGFTISYSFKRNTWISYHVYFPDYYMYTKDMFFSSVENLFRSHNSIFYNNIYEKDTLFAIDLPVSSGIHTKIIDSLIIYLRTKKVSGDRFVDVKEFFDSIIAYNDYQSTGIRNISTSDSLSDYVSNDNVIAIRLDREWMLNNLMDYCVNPDIPFFDMFIVKDKMLLDKEYDERATDINKTWYEVQPFIDSHMFIRLMLTGKKEVNFILKSIIDKETISE